MHNDSVHVAKCEPRREKRKDPKRDAITMIMILALGVIMSQMMRMLVAMSMMTAKTMKTMVAVTNTPMVRRILMMGSVVMTIIMMRNMLVRMERMTIMLMMKVARNSL